MKKTLFTFVAGAMLWSAAGSAAACDRECLRGHVTQYLHALIAHDHNGLPLAESVRFTENSKESKFGEGLWRSVTKLRGYRQDFIDEREGVIGSHVILEESGSPMLLVLRLKVADEQITEVETVTTRGRAEGVLLNIDNLDIATAKMQYVPRPEQLESRDEAIRIASLYPAGLKEGSFVAVDLPYTLEAYRLENGEIMAGPACTRFPGCDNIKTQDISPGRTTITQRLIAVDERLGIVWFRLSWERGEGTRLVVWEAFKVYDGQMHAVEAFMKLDPKDLGSGWE